MIKKLFERMPFGMDRQELMLCLFTVVCGIVALIVNGGAESVTDTVTCLEAWNVIRTGGIDYMCTPVFPIVLGTVKALAGETLWEGVIALLQLAVLTVSVCCFYRLCREFLHSERTAFWLSMILSVVTTTWIVFILTEPLVVSLTVFLLRVTVHLYERFSVRNAIMHGVLLLLLVFLRPAMIYLLPVFGVWWIFAAFKGRCLHSAAGIAGVVVVSGAMLLYMHAFERTYGRFMITAVTMTNQVEAARRYVDDDRGVIKIDDPVLMRELVESDSVNGNTYDRLMTYYREHPAVLAKSTFSRIYRLRSSRLFDFFMGPLATLTDIFMPRLPVVYLFLLFYGVLLACVAIRQRRLPPLSLLIWVLAMSHVAVTVVGAPCDYERLLLPAWPMLLLLTGQTVAMLRSGGSIANVDMK